MEVATPPKRNRKQQRWYDGYLYRLHHFIENAFLRLNAGGGCYPLCRKYGFFSCRCVDLLPRCLMRCPGSISCMHDPNSPRPFHRRPLCCLSAKPPKEALFCP